MGLKTRFEQILPRPGSHLLVALKALVAHDIENGRKCKGVVDVEAKDDVAHVTRAVTHRQAAGDTYASKVQWSHGGIIEAPV